VISTVTLSIEFIAFEYVGKEKPSTYLLKSTVEGSPSEIVELTREVARATAEKLLEVEEREILSIDVYEVRFLRPFVTSATSDGSPGQCNPRRT